jgi:hypothetical protein
MPDLITLSTAENYISTSSPNTTLLSSLISNVSQAIVRYCKRDFVSTVRDELYNGNGEKRLCLRHFPIISVTSVRYRPVNVLRIINTDQGTNQQARAQITSTGIQLTRVASGVLHTETLIDFASHATLIACANAINALGNSWQAQVVGDAIDYALWPSADLWIADGGGQGQGSLTARGAFAAINMHTYELQGYQWDQRRGWLLRAIPYTDPELMHPEDLVWPVGINNFRVQYTSGFATVPLDVQEACGEWVAALYWQAQRDPGLKQESIPGSVTRTPFSTMPPGVQALLATYRDFKLLSFGG